MWWGWLCAVKTDENPFYHAWTAAVLNHGGFYNPDKPDGSDPAVLLYPGVCSTGLGSSSQVWAPGASIPHVFSGFCFPEGWFYRFPCVLSFSTQWLSRWGSEEVRYLLNEPNRWKLELS